VCSRSSASFTPLSLLIIGSSISFAMKTGDEQKLVLKRNLKQVFVRLLVCLSKFGSSLVRNERTNEHEYYSVHVSNRDRDREAREICIERHLQRE